MSFFLVSKGLTYVGTLSGVWRTFKLLRAHSVSTAAVRGDDDDSEEDDCLDGIARKRRRSGVHSGARPLLMYWTVFAFLHTYDAYFEMFFSWFFFYYLGKCAILLWLLFPSLKGSDVLYDQVAAPIMERYQPWNEDFVKPRIRASLNAFLRLERNFHVSVLGSLSAAELKALQAQTERALQGVHQERRRREGLCDERECGDGDDQDSRMLALPRASSAKGVRKRRGSSLHDRSDEEEDSEGWTAVGAGRSFDDSSTVSDYDSVRKTATKLRAAWR